MKNRTNLLLASIIFILYSCTDKIPTSKLINVKASLPPSFEFVQSNMKAMATFINEREQTMSMLYGNSLALNKAKTGKNTISGRQEFALVTWDLQADVNWYGAKIPGDIRSVEVLKTNQENGKVTFSNYQRYDGKPLALNIDTSTRQARITYILTQKPSVMP